MRLLSLAGLFAGCADPIECGSGTHLVTVQRRLAPRPQLFQQAD